MGLSPIAWSEIAIYDRETFAGLSAWAKRLIRRIDDAVLRVVADDRDKASPDSGGQPDQVPVSDVRGLKAMFRGMAAKVRG